MLQVDRRLRKNKCADSYDAIIMSYQLAGSLVECRVSSSDACDTQNVQYPRDETRATATTQGDSV